MFTEPLSNEDIDAIAKLHFESLPDSAFSILGTFALRVFYKFCATSPFETVFVERSTNLKIISVAVSSQSTESLMLRMFYSRPILFLLFIIKIFEFPIFKAIFHIFSQNSGLHYRGCELIFVFVSNEYRGCGFGKRIVYKAIEKLVSNGENIIFVKTFPDMSHPVVVFYKSIGFHVIGTTTSLGRKFLVLNRNFDI